MAAVSKTVQSMINLMDSFMFGPAKRYVTPADQLQFLNAAALQTSVDLGGLSIRQDVPMIAGTSLYAVDTQHKVLVSAYYVANPGLSTETRVPMTLETPESRDDRQRLGAVTMDGVSPLYVMFRPEVQALYIEGTPTDSTSVLRCLWRSLANDLLGGSDYVGDEAETLPIVYKACQFHSVKEKMFSKAREFENYYKDALGGCLGMRSRARASRTMQDGRFIASRTRSRNTPK